MRTLLVSLLLISFLEAEAQKTVRKSVLLPQEHLLQIHARQCYQVELQSVIGRQLTLEATMEGEYEGELLLQWRTEGATTMVYAGTQPLFGQPQDKLGAHKVVSVALKIQIPQDQRVQLFAEDAQITARGRYQNLQVYLDQGRCSLLGVSQQAEVVTREADILLESTAASISASSKYGTVSPHQIPAGNPRFILQTISGNIHLLRKE